MRRHDLNAKTHRTRKMRGMSVVEFALLLPVLLGMVLIVVEIGNVYFTQATLAKAAKAGVRFAVTGQGEMEGDRIERIHAKVRELSDVIALPDPLGALTITVRSWDNPLGNGEAVTGDAGRPCNMVEVAASYPYEPVTPFVGAIIDGKIQLEGNGRMVNEPWQPCEIEQVADQ